MAPPSDFIRIHGKTPPVRAEILDRSAPLERDVAPEEVIAETTAFVVAARLGFDTTAYSLPYVGHWAQGQPERLRAVTQEIARRVRVLLTALAPVWPIAEPEPLASAGYPRRDAQEFSLISLISYNAGRGWVT